MRTGKVSAVRSRISFWFFLLPLLLVLRGTAFAAVDQTLYADENMLKLVMRNLVSNALKYTGVGGEVAVLAEVEKETLIISVADNGVGMTREALQKLFTKDRVNSVGTANEIGTGLGLMLCKEFIEKNGGSLSVESEPGKGSIFTVCLPLERVQPPALSIAKPHNGHEAPTPPAKANPSITRVLDQLTILLVEDNDDFRTYLRDNLNVYYKIIEAVDGKDGWQKAISRHPDVIVSDISMPNMDGIELSRKIKSDKRVSHIPVILLTALTENAYQLQGLETGASDYLTKPFPFEILNIKIRNLVLLNQRLRETYSRRLSVETPVTAVQSEDEKLMLKVTQYIESNLDSANLSVEELSKHVYMSHASLYRKIVDLTGETPVEFIRSVKLKKAADLLATSDLKISEIGYAVGFTTPNYFTRAFRAKFNISPSEYMSLKRKQAG